MKTRVHKVLRVRRTRAQAKKTYDKLSRFYDFFIGVFEKKYRNKALEQLQIKQGETILEIGFGTGHCLKQIAEKVGANGKAYGVDISSGMLEVTGNRLKKHGFLDRVELYRGDAMEMSYVDNKFDAVFMSFTLELFDTPEIPKILNEIKRVLKPEGRLGVVSLSKDYGETMSLKLYEWFHEKFPRYADCRPIYVVKSLRDKGYNIKYKEMMTLFGLPIVIVIAIKPD